MNDTVDIGQSDLLAYALLDLDPRVESFRQPLQIFLVSLTLFELGKPVKREEILEVCNRQLPSNDGITAEQLDAAIEAGRNLGLLETKSHDQVALSNDRKKQLQTASNRINMQREAFHREMSSAVSNATGEVLTPFEQEEFRRALEGFIQKLFQERSVALARSFGPNGTGFNAETAEHLSGKSLDAIARAVASGNEKLRRAQITQGIRDGLLNLNVEGRKYLAAVYQKTVAFALLQQDPSVIKVKRSLARNRVCYLDTNVLMALMFSAHPHHEPATTAIDAARHIGCRMVVSPYTITELERQLHESNEHYGRLRQRGELLEIADDDALRTFAAQKAVIPGLTWTAFLATFSPPTEYLGEQNIDTVDTDAAAAHHHEKRDRVRAAIAAVKAPYTHRTIIDVDTDNFLVVQLRRKALRADEMGSRVWLITLDRSLKEADRTLVKDSVFRVPASKRLDGWAADLSPYLSPEDQDLGEYALHLIQSELGLLAEDPVFADINFLSTLEESPFDLDALLKGSSRQTRRVLVALQEEREVAEVMGEEPEDPAEREPWAGRVAEVVEKTLKKLELESEKGERLEEIEAERDLALRRELTARKQRDRSKRRIAALQRQMDLEQMQTQRPRYWKRLIEWLRSKVR